MYVMLSAMGWDKHLSDADIDGILRRNDTGVIALATGSRPYATPVSFGYREDDRTFYIRFVAVSESDKQELLETTESASLVVYEQEEDTVTSVIATGQVERVHPEDLTEDDLVHFGQAKRPLYDMWDESLSELDIQLVKITPDALTGRRLPLEDLPDEAIAD